MNRKVLTILSVLTLSFLFSTKTYATSVNDYLVDGKLEVNSISPTSWEEAYDYIGSYLMGKEGVLSGTANSCNSDFSVCEVSAYFSDSSSSTETLEIVYQPTNSVVKSRVDSFIDSMGDNAVFDINDLEVINYITNSTRVYSGTIADRVMMANYSGELKNKLENSNIFVDFRTATAAGSDAPLYKMASGDIVLRFNDVGYGYKPFVTVRHKNILYVPTDTAEDEYMEVAQERINNYLGNSEVVLSTGGELSSLIPDPEDLAYILNELGVSGVDRYYTLTYEETSYNFLIIADSTKMVTPSLITQDLITNAQISTLIPDIPLDSAINANILTSGDEYDEIVETLNNEDVQMFDLKLYSKSLNSNITELSNGTFEVKVPVPSKLEGKDLIVYYVPSEGDVEEHEVSVSNGYAVFTTNHFSIYTLSEEIADQVTEANPETYDGIVTWIALGSISLVGLIGTVIYKRKYSI